MELSTGWTVAAAPPGRIAGPEDLAKESLDWWPARVPGTVAGAVPYEHRDLDAEDWWFRRRFEIPGDDADGDLFLELDGLATVCDVYVNGRHLLSSSSMWRAHVVAVREIVIPGQLNELVIACRALRPLLERRRRPRARWRTRVVNDNNLRWYRSMIFGRSPGFAPSPAAVGPWRPVRIVRRRPDVPTAVSVTTRLDDDAGYIRASAALPGGGLPHWSLVVGDSRVEAEVDPGGSAVAELRIDDAARWWPHTHGTPRLHDVAIEQEGEVIATRRVGFRELRFPEDIPRDGLALEINGVDIHVRGAVWTPVDLVGLACEPGDLRRILERVRDCGMNLLRVVGTGHYESADFHDLCDELGILVWQDLMFAVMDYPMDDREFRSVVEEEARVVIAELAHRPSLVCVCGNSEVEQQPAMMGLDPSLGRHEFWERTLSRLLRESHSDAACIRSTPCGGVMPFHPDLGVTHYFGVSGYFRDPGDVRRSEVKFASECLAFANVPDKVEFPVHHPQWKAGVQRDAGTGWDLGAGWDFDDVRDHYLNRLFGVDPVALRRSDHERYLALSRMVTGEVMAGAMNEWRRAQSPCRGALVLWLKDMAAGAGLGVLDVHGEPKVCYHHLRRALAPTAVWMTDEGLAGVAIHVANDPPNPLQAVLGVALYRDDVEVARAEEEINVAGHTSMYRSVESMLGRFVDAAWAYRFGPPAASVIVATLMGSDETRPISQAFWFPERPPLAPRPPTALGITAAVEGLHDGVVSIAIRSDACVYGARVRAEGFRPSDDAFCVEPGGGRVIDLVPDGQGTPFVGAAVGAVNLSTSLTVPRL
jgi:beta-mannosidase